MAKFAIAGIPAKDDVGNMAGVTGAALEFLITLYFRIMGDLAQIAETTEISLGLAKLPDPKEVFPSSRQSA